MPKQTIKVYVEPELYAKLASAAKEKYITVPAWLLAAGVDALPKQVTAKPLSAREEKAAKEATRKARVQAMFRQHLAGGWTQESILASCATWRDEAGRWLAEVVNEAHRVCPVCGDAACETKSLECGK
jgi:hypothetical protein